MDEAQARSPAAIAGVRVAAHGTDLEWLETDGLGGFASGTAAGIRTRRYHALLLVATTPPSGRMVLVNGLEVWVESAAGHVALSSQDYGDGVVYPDGAARIASFSIDPWPSWRFALPGGAEIVQEILVPRGVPSSIVSFRLQGEERGAVLCVRPLLSGRDFHALHHENPNFHFAAQVGAGRVVWRPYAGVPAVLAVHNGAFAEQPDWYRNFLYRCERERGLDDHEDLASPGVFRFELSAGEAHVGFALAERDPKAEPDWADAAEREPLTAVVARVRSAERERRGRAASRLERAVEAYLASRAEGQTVIAGYPWFGDWGRDTFISLRGLCLATGRLAEAREILLAWSGAVSQGMLPNRFPDRGSEPEYNSVDASLWYVIAVDEFLDRAAHDGLPLGLDDRRRLRDAVIAILAGYAGGTRYGIRCDRDGLLAAGEPGVQLTWMDAKVGDWVVTPRIGKPVEVQALWLNALWTAVKYEARWAEIFQRGQDAFRARFWNAERGFLYDVVDADHRPGACDASLRPNQVFAAGGLPLSLLEPERSRAVVDAVEAQLWTPLGLRSLGPGEPGYRPRYQGGVRERDSAYHQGTVWPWLLGPFVEAWVRVRGGGADVKQKARDRFLAPILAHLDDAGLGHVSEIADGEPPHTPRGCPFQAWSVGEALRLANLVLR